MGIELRHQSESEAFAGRKRADRRKKKKVPRNLKKKIESEKNSGAVEGPESFLHNEEKNWSVEK